MREKVIVAMKSAHLLIAIVGLQSCCYSQDNGSLPGTTNDAMWGYHSPAVYQILPRPRTHLNKSDQHVFTPPQAAIQSRQMQPYAYGWFGTKASPHWYRQFGTQSAYTQWTLR